MSNEEKELCQIIRNASPEMRDLTGMVLSLFTSGNYNAIEVFNSIVDPYLEAGRLKKSIVREALRKAVAL